MKKLSFVIVGTFKAASSTIAYKLKSDPRIGIPSPKDPYFFLRDFCRTLEKPKEFLEIHHANSVYEEEKFDRSFGNNTSEEVLIGEATPLYLYKYEEAIPELKRNNTEIKIIVILRNPVERAYSNYLHNVKDGYENRKFSDVISDYKRLEVQSLHPFFHYVSAGFYYKQLLSYFDSFSKVKVVFYEDYVNNQYEVLKSIFDFLELDFQTIECDNIRLNKTGIVKYQVLHRFITNESKIKTFFRPVFRFIIMNHSLRKRFTESIKNMNLKRPSLSLADREHLESIYYDDVKKLGKLLNMDVFDYWFHK